MRRLAGCFAMVALILKAPAAGAGEEMRLEQARKQMELGQEAFNQKKYSEAVVYFEAAFEAAPFAAFLYNAGLACERGQNPTRALELYKRYLEMEPEAADAEKIKEKIEALAAAAEKTAAGEKVPEPPPAEEGKPEPEVQMKSLISVRTNPKDATIRIMGTDGNPVSSAKGPLAQTVEAGTYIVEASHPDYRTVTTEISVTSGQVYVVVVEMSQGAFLGFLKVATNIPGAGVYVDKKEEGQAGVTPYGNVIPVGKHRIFVEKPGYTPIEQQIDVAMGEEVELTLTLKRLDYGAMKVKTNIKGVQIYVDEKLAGAVDDKQALTKLLPAGTYKVRASAEDMKDYVTNVTVEGGKDSKLLVRMNPKPSRTSGYVSAGFAVALFGAGGAFGGLALNRKNSLASDRESGRLAADDPRIMEGFLWGIGADMSFAVGAIVAGMSLYYFLRDPLPPSEGKTPTPTDFTENPKDGPAAAEATAPPPQKTPESAPRADATKASARNNAPRWLLAPLIGNRTAGLGLTLAF